MEDLKNKKVLVMGLGLHGGGLAVVNWLVDKGAKVTITDLKTKKQLQDSLDKLETKVKNKVTFVLGKHRVSDFKSTDVVVQNPSVPRESKFLKIALESGACIVNDAFLFIENCPAKIIAVTGTRGKSTTSTLIYELLKNSSFKYKIWLAGLPQKPELEILNKVKSKDLVVLELSSWQLEVLGQKDLSPGIAVVTNIYPDHLNRYKSMSQYIKAKENIFINQSKNNFVILNYDNTETKKMGQKVPSSRLWFSKKNFSSQNGVFIRSNKIIYRIKGVEKNIIDLKDVKLIGQHNLENILAALSVVCLLGIKVSVVKKVLSNFKNLKGREEFIKTVRGVDYINDTTATTPDGTIAALKAFGKNKNIVLIAGGDSKNIPNNKYLELAKICKKNCKAAVLLQGRGSIQFKDELKKVNYKPLVFGLDNMTDAVSVANSFVKKGDIVILSPACSSFNMYVNEFDRGDQFVKIVKAL